MDNYPVKNFASTYIYGKGDYERPLMNSIMTCNRIDKNSKEFEMIAIDVKKRQETVVLLDVLMNDNIVLMMNAKALPQAFSVFTAKDIKTDKSTKVFIDCTNIFKYNNGFYTCNRIDVLIAYLMTAMTNLIYYTEPRRIITNNNLTTALCECYVSMFLYILDYLRLNGVAENRAKLQYIIACFFQYNVLGKPISDSTRNTAAKVAGITLREANIIDILYDPKRDFRNINTFITRLVDVFHFKGFTIDVFIERWIYLFGVGTQFGPELFVSFSSIITNAYSGAYLNQQKTIEKCVGRQMVIYTTSLLKIGYESLR